MEETIEKIPVERLKKAAKEKLANQMGLTIGAFLLQIVILVAVFFIIAIALSGTVLAPIMARLQGVASEADLIKAEQEMFEMTNTTYYRVVSELISAAMGALFATLSTGYIRICLKIARSETASIKDLFYVYKHNPDRVILLYLLTFAIQLVIGLPSDIITYFASNDPTNTGLYVLSMVVLVITTVLTVIFSLMVSLEFYIYTDDSDMPVIEIFKKSIADMKGNKKRLFALEVSFLGWLFLCIMTCGVLSIWLIPYFEMTLAEFYRTVEGERLWIPTSDYNGDIDPSDN